MPKSINIAVLCIVFLCILIGKAIAVVPLVPLLIVVSIFLFIFAFVYTDSAMVLLIFAMLLSPEFAFGALSKQRNIVVRVDDLLIVVFACAWLARAALTKNRGSVRKLPLNRFIFFYCVTFILSTLQGMILGNVVPAKGIFFMLKYIEYFMVFYLAAAIIRDKKQVTMYLKAFLIVFVIVNVCAFLQIGHVDRVSAPFQTKGGEPNTLGGYQVLVLGIIIGLLTHIRSLRWQVPLILIAAFSLIPFAYTLSRASYMALIPMYLTLIIFSKRRTKNILVGLLIVFVTASFFVFPSIIKERISYTFTPEIDETVTPVTIGGVTLDPSASARINDWVRLFEEWKRKPFMGHGLTGAGFVDSQFVTVLVETGLLGLFAFVLLLWNISIQALRIYKSTTDDFYSGLAIGFLAGHFGMIIHAFTANTFIVIRIMEPYWFFASIVMMIPKLETQAVLPPAVEEKKPNEQYITNTIFLLKNGKCAT